MGFGNSPFGNSPFGITSWAARVLTGRVPAEPYFTDDDKQTSPTRPLQRFLAVLEAVVEPLRMQVARWLDLQDPFRVPFTRPVTGFLQLSVGDEVFTRAYVLTGTLAFTNSSATVTGEGTQFTKELKAGMFIRPISSGAVSIVDSVDSDTQVTLKDAFSGSTVADIVTVTVPRRGVVSFVSGVTDVNPAAAPNGFASTSTRLVVDLDLPLTRTIPAECDYLIFDISEGDQLALIEARELSMVTALGESFGVEIDANEEEDVSRSSLWNLVGWTDQKGSAPGYDYFGKVYGFKVSVQGLWKFDPVTYAPSWLASFGRTFQDTNGDWLTTVPPMFVRADDFAGDLLPLDVLWYGASADQYEIATSLTAGPSSMQAYLGWYYQWIKPGWIVRAGGLRYMIEAVNAVSGLISVLPIDDTDDEPVPGAVSLRPNVKANETALYAKTSRVLVNIEPDVRDTTETYLLRLQDRLKTETKPKHVNFALVTYRRAGEVDCSPTMAGTTTV